MVAHQGLYLTSDMKNNTRLKAPSTVGNIGNTLHHIYIGKKANNCYQQKIYCKGKVQVCPTLNNFLEYQNISLLFDTTVQEERKGIGEGDSP